MLLYCRCVAYSYGNRNELEGIQILLLQYFCSTFTWSQRQHVHVTMCYTYIISKYCCYECPFENSKNLFFFFSVFNKKSEKHDRKGEINTSMGESMTDLFIYYAFFSYSEEDRFLNTNMFKQNTCMKKFFYTLEFIDNQYINICDGCLRRRCYCRLKITFAFLCL